MPLQKASCISLSIWCIRTDLRLAITLSFLLTSIAPSVAWLIVVEMDADASLMQPWLEPSSFMRHRKPITSSGWIVSGRKWHSGRFSSKNARNLANGASYGLWYPCFRACHMASRTGTVSSFSAPNFLMKTLRSKSVLMGSQIVAVVSFSNRLRAPASGISFSAVVLWRLDGRSGLRLAPGSI